MHTPRVSKKALFLLTFVTVSLGLAHYTNAQTGSWFPWDDVFSQVSQQEHTEEQGVQGALVVEADTQPEPVDSELAAEAGEPAESEPAPAEEKEQDVDVVETNEPAPDSVPTTTKEEVPDGPVPSSDTDDKGDATEVCPEATTPEEDGILDEENWKCQEAALEENKPMMLRTMAAPMSMSLAVAPALLTATLDSLNSQNFPFVYLNARVSYDGVPLSDLSADAFQCTENGTAQTLAVTPPETGGNVRLADVVFLIDASGSMGSRITGVRNNIVAFANGLAASDVDFRLGLVQFGQGANGGQPMVFGGGTLTGDIVLFKSYVDQLRATGGYEPGFSAMRTAAQTFNFRPGAQKIFLIVTDEDSDDRDKAGTISLMQANDIIVHAAASCASGQSNNDYCNDMSVRAATGGLLFPVAGPYNDVLDTIVAQTASTYVIRYKSTSPDFDGVERLVECTIARDGEQAVVQDSYIPGSAPAITLSPQTKLLNESTLPEDSPDAIVRVRVVDEVQPTVAAGGVKLFYRTTGQATYSVRTMTLQGEYYEATILTVKRYGVEYYVTATDGQQTSALPSIDPSITPFTIAVLPNVAPVITHAPVESAPRSQSLTIRADVVDTTNTVASVELSYRNVGELSYTTVPMTNTAGNVYEVTIPAEDTADDVEYYVYSKDDYGVAAFAATKDEPYVVSIGASTPLSLTFSTEQGFNDGTNDPLNKNFAAHPDMVPQKINTRPISFKAVYTHDAAPDNIHVVARQEKDLRDDDHVFEMVDDEAVRANFAWRDVSEVYPGETGRLLGYDTGFFDIHSGFAGDESLDLTLPGGDKSEVRVTFVTTDFGSEPGYPKATVQLEAYDANGNALDTESFDVNLGPGEQPQTLTLRVQDVSGSIDRVRFSVDNTDESETWIRAITVYETLPMERDTNPETAPVLRDNDFANGEQYVATSTFASRGDYDVQIVASSTDGQVGYLPENDWLPFSIKELFVYVALGDSYQSGEGVGNSYAATADYLNAYENGTNAGATTVGAQENTYTNEVDAFTERGNSCHRALENYAQLSRRSLRPDLDDDSIVLVDRTCSGAEIANGDVDQQVIVGPHSEPRYSQRSQIAEVVRRLESAGLSADDVDVVTVGMGGNDARFGGVVAACVTNSILQKGFEAYPGVAPEVLSVVQNGIDLPFGFTFDPLSCKKLTDWMRADGEQTIEEVIDGLAELERFAQTQLVGAFPQARIFQLSYPNLLPAEDVTQPYCGGIMHKDLGFATGVSTGINRIVSSTVQGASARDSRYQLVDTVNAFGVGALCTGSYANQVTEDNIDAEVSRLLNLTGEGDEEMRSLIDDVVYRVQVFLAELARCMDDEDCSVLSNEVLRARAQEGAHAISALQTYVTLASTQQTLRANLAAQPTAGAESEAIRFDRSRGLFHPNLDGVRRLACYVEKTFRGESTDECSRVATRISAVLQQDTVNGVPVTNAPIDAAPGQRVDGYIGGFAPYTLVQVVFLSRPQTLATLTSDADGVIETSVELPDAGPGVHLLQFRGLTVEGTGLHKQVLVEYAGRPSGAGSYKAYLCGFSTDIASGKREAVNVYYLEDIFGGPFFTKEPDENGCVLVEVPVLDLIVQPRSVTIRAVGTQTGTEVIETVKPVPSVVGIWTTSNSRNVLSVTGANTRITGKVHSESDIKIAGAGITLTERPEYVTDMRVMGMNTVPEGVQVETGGMPKTYDIVDYRPGGVEALRAAEEYHAIPQSLCKGGTWTVVVRNIPEGVVYVPCGLRIVGARATVNTQLVVEGNVLISGSDITIDPDTHNVALLSNQSVHVAGQGIHIDGTVQALRGLFRSTGANAVYHCGIVAERATITGVNASVLVDAACRFTE